MLIVQINKEAVKSFRGTLVFIITEFYQVLTIATYDAAFCSQLTKTAKEFLPRSSLNVKSLLSSLQLLDRNTVYFN